MSEKKWNKRARALTLEHVKAGLQCIINNLTSNIQNPKVMLNPEGTPQGKTICFDVWHGELTQRDCKTDEEKGKVYFGQLVYVTTDLGSHQALSEEITAFIHSKGKPTVQFIVPPGDRVDKHG